MPTGIVLGGSLYYRTSPSSSATYHSLFPNGTVLNVTVYNNAWYKVIQGSTTGYVMRAYVACAGDTVKVTGSNVNVRSVPSTSNSSVLYRLSSPTTAVVESVTNNWVKIKPANKNAGWMSADYLEKTSSSNPGSGSTISGVIGNGPNSTVSAADIRADIGKYWQKDYNTTHPQIMGLQRMLQDYYDTYLQFSDYGPLTIDGIYGEDTKQYVYLFQQYSGRGLEVDGIVGYCTLLVLEEKMHATII